ncbi:MAG: nitroreductase family protein [Fusobacteriaceae bacterium]|nr:nitroreductase family protein [Fusobacteriaceae bacterium]
MKFIDLVKKRYSLRSYSNKKVDRKKIELCLESARLSPSACNSQPWSFIVIDDEKTKAKIADKTNLLFSKINKFLFDAPVIIAVITEKPNIKSQIGGFLKKKDFNLIDVGIAIEHLCLQATELGLGTCIIGWFNEKFTKQILNIPKNKRIGLLISLGYSKTDAIPEKKRKSLNKIFKYNKK